MRDAVIVEAVRTPTGKRNGGLSGVHSADLSAHVLRVARRAHRHRPGRSSTTSSGAASSQIGEQTFDIARTAVLSAGWPESVPGTTVDRQCGSSPAGRALRRRRRHLRAVRRRRRRRRRGHVAARRWARAASPPARSAPTTSPATAATSRTRASGAEQIADTWGFSRAAARRVRPALPRAGRRGQRRAARFDAQIAPVTDPDGVVVSADEGIRRGGTLETLAGAQAGLQRGRQDHGRQLLADLRRLGRAAGHDQREGRARSGSPRSRASTPRVARRRRPDADAARPDAGDAEGARQARPVGRPTSARTRSTRPSPRCRWPG